MIYRDGVAGIHLLHKELAENCFQTSQQQQLCELQVYK